MYEVSEAYKSAIVQQSRNFRLGGNIRMQSGDTVILSDGNVVGEMKIETQCMSGSSYEQMLDIGAVCAAKLTMTVRNASGSDSFADARVRPLVGLEISENNFEDIPMGIFYVDNTTVERVKDRVTFSAYDKMIFLHFLITDTMRSNMKNMPPYAACAYVCSLAGIQMAQSGAEVTAFPNGSVLPDYSDASIETARDLIMWCAQLMGCFARIDRHGKLEFVQLKAENDVHGMIIPVREIAARQRYSTKFADGVIRITRLSMKKSDGKMASTVVKYSGSTKRSAELELEQNPLILSLTDKTVGECLRDILRAVKTAYFRPFQSDIANDPALDAGDYVRLRGGSIDTSRGYGTGIITHNIWRYRGIHRIFNVGSVPAMYQLDDESSAAEIAAVSEIALFSDNSEDDGGSDDVDGTDLVYVQPKSQLEKEIDGLRGKSGSGGVGKASANYPTSEYFNNYTANVAEGVFCHSEGTGTAIRGEVVAAHAEGAGSMILNSNFAHAEGTNNVIISGAVGAHTEGLNNVIESGIGSHAEGQNNHINGGYFGHAEGSGNTISSGNSAHAEGGGNTVSGNNAHAEGSGNTVSGNNAHAEGSDNTVSCSNAHVEGLHNEAGGTDWLHIIGDSNKITGASGACVFGTQNIVSAKKSIVAGNNNTVSGEGNIVLGSGSNATAHGYSVTIGRGLIGGKSARESTCLGAYNAGLERMPGTSIDVLLEIGNGRSGSTRSSAFVIDADGNVYCNKIIETGTSNVAEISSVAALSDTNEQIATHMEQAENPSVRLIDHSPTAADLTGEPGIILQCAETAEVDGEGTGIFRIINIFVEK